MPTTGPWIQPADTTTIVQWTEGQQAAPINSFPGQYADAVKRGVVTVTGADFVAVSDAQVLEALTTAFQSGEESVIGSGADHHYGTRVERVYEGVVFADQYSIADATIGLLPWAMVPGYPSNVEPGYIPLYWETTGLVWPDGAIDIEHEGEIAEPLGLTLLGTSEMAAINVDNSNRNDEALTGEPRTYVKVGPLGLPAFDPVVVHQFDALGTARDLGVDIDLTEHLLNGHTDTGLKLFTESSDLVPPRNPTIVGGNQEYWEYGWWFTKLRLEWLIRPPRYRFIFEGDEAVPYRRTFPRDDGLAGGSPRNYPPSKAAQSSNRTSGGYL